MRKAMQSALGVSAAIVVSLALAQGARASGGSYLFDGGTPFEQQQVRQALEVSSFDWSLVRQQVTIHIARDVTTEATPGQIWLDANLLDAGQFSWGVVQHEYAHQVDFFLFDDATRARLLVLLGGSDWCHGVSGLQHGQYGCERFASTLAWAYWQSPANSMKPQSAGDESAAMNPAAFRALMASLLGGASAGNSLDPAAYGYAPPKESVAQARTRTRRR